MVEKPYTIIRKTPNFEIRYFSNLNPRNLFWHRDKEDREVELIYGKVELQLDNHLPFSMSVNKRYSIPKYVYHRLLSKTDFLLKIYFVGE